MNKRFDSTAPEAYVDSFAIAGRRDHGSGTGHGNTAMPFERDRTAVRRRAATARRRHSYDPCQENVWKNRQ